MKLSATCSFVLLFGFGECIDSVHARRSLVGRHQTDENDEVVLSRERGIRRDGNEEDDVSLELVAPLDKKDRAECDTTTPRNNDVCQLREGSIDALIYISDTTTQILKIAPICKFWPKINLFAMYCQYVSTAMSDMGQTMKGIKGTGDDFANNCLQTQVELDRIIRGMQYTRPLVTRMAIQETQEDLGGYSFVTDFSNRIGQGCLQDYTNCEDVCTQLIGADCVNGDRDCLDNCRKLLVQQCSPDLFNRFDSFCQDLEKDLQGNGMANVPPGITDELLRGCNEIRSEYQTFCQGAFEDDRCANIVLFDENINNECLSECDRIQQENACQVGEQCCEDNRKCGECCSDEECVAKYGLGAICPAETNLCEGGLKCTDTDDCEEGKQCCLDNPICGECCSDDECVEMYGDGSFCPFETNDCVGGLKCQDDFECALGQTCCPETNKCGECCFDDDCPGDSACLLETNQCEEQEESCGTSCNGSNPICCQGTRFYLWLLCSKVQGASDTFCCSESAAKIACV